MRELVRGDTTTQLDKKVEAKERTGWKRITENKLDDSGFSLSWVCVMEINGVDTRNKNKWGRFS